MNTSTWIYTFCGPVGLLVALLLGGCGDDPAGQGLGEACGSFFDLDHDGAPDGARGQCAGDLWGWAPGDLPESRAEYRMTDVNGVEHVSVSCTSWWSPGYLSYAQVGETWQDAHLSRSLIDGEPYGPADGMWDWEETLWYEGTCP